MIGKILQKIAIKIRSVWYSIRTKTPLKNKIRVLGKISFRTQKMNLRIGKNVTLFKGVVFWGNGPIVIGDNVTIADDVIILSASKEGIIIGNDTMIAARCYLIDSNHGHFLHKGPMWKQSLVSKRIIIGNDCWICSNCVCGPGSVMPNGSVLGACSFLNKDFSKYENYIIGGVPAKPIKVRE